MPFWTTLLRWVPTMSSSLHYSTPQESEIKDLERQVQEWKMKCEAVEKREAERREADAKKHKEEVREGMDVWDRQAGIQEEVGKGGVRICLYKQNKATAAERVRYDFVGLEEGSQG